MPIAAGELDRQIVIEARTAVRSDTGEETYTWSEFATVWAKRLPVKASEYFAGQAINAPVDAMFRIRWLSGLDSTMRINYDGNYYDILSLQEIGRREGFDIMARVHQQ